MTDAERISKGNAWTCDYCGSHGHPMDHGCLPINLKERISTLEEQNRIMRQAIEKVLTQFKSLKMHQYRLLVRGQDLESAGKNWDEATQDMFVDFAPLEEALAKVKK